MLKFLSKSLKKQVIKSTPVSHNSSSQLLQTPAATIVYNYPPQPKLTGLVKEVKVVSGNHPCDFYCQLADNFSFILGLMAKMNATYAGWMS